MSHYQPYPAYKDSGVEWLGMIPEHWEIVPICSIFQRGKITNRQDEELLSVYRDYGVVPKKSRDGNNNKASEDLSVYQFVGIGNLVINKMKAWQGSIAISAYRGIVSPAYFVYQQNHNHNENYLHHLFRSLPYISGYMSASEGVRVNQWDLNPDLFRRFPVLLPTVGEQISIAVVLDRETARIDSLITKKTRFIELLKEKRQALITQAVTKGLDPHVKMKDSGVEWLGEVPEHWMPTPLQYVIEKIEQGWSPECLGYPAENEEWGVVKSGCVNGGVFSPEENKKLPDGLQVKPEIAIKSGDLLMSRASGSIDLIGSVGLVKNFHGNLMLSDKIFRIILNSKVDKSYFALAMTSQLIREQIKISISGAEGLANNLPQSRIKKFWLPIPGKNEQKIIFKYVDEQINRLYFLISKSENSITLLKERRSALITAAVTGQIDLREAA